MSDSRRMTASERRTQLVEIAKTLFAEVGFDGASIEEIASRAKVSKPVVYEHFGGKQGVYAVVVDRESSQLVSHITARLDASFGGREQLYASAMAFLDYIEADPQGFRVLIRDSPSGFSTGGMAGLLADVASRAEAVLREVFNQVGIDPEVAPLYAHGLVGMVSQIGAWWSEERPMPKEDAAAHVTALAYSGLANMPRDPTVLSEGTPRSGSARSSRTRPR